MNLLESIRVAFVALRTNKLRSLLTMLGIIIGVGAVIGMLAIGNGFRQFLDSQFDQLGIGSFYIFAGSTELAAGSAAYRRRRGGAGRARRGAGGRRRGGAAQPRRAGERGRQAI